MLLLNIAKIYHSFEANNLIHVIDSDLEGMLLLKTIDALVIPTSYILLKFQCYFISKVSLDYIGKRVWHLSFGGYHSSDKTSSR